MPEDDWQRTQADEERDEAMSRIFGLYYQARGALTAREAFGYDVIDANEMDGAPDWLKANLDESGLAVLRQELIEVFNQYRPADGWEYPDGEESGGWKRLPQDPEKLIEWTDNHARSQIGEIAISTLRRLNRGATK